MSDDVLKTMHDALGGYVQVRRVNGRRAYIWFYEGRRVFLRWVGEVQGL